VPRILQLRCSSEPTKVQVSHVPNFACQAGHDAIIRPPTCMLPVALMNASHEASAPKPMPFIHDTTLAPSVTNGETQVHPPHSLTVSSPTSTITTPTHPHQTQSATALIHHPLPLPPTMPEDATLSAVQESSASPHRARANTGVTKPRGSTKQLTEEDASWWTEEIHKHREIR